MEKIIWIIGNNRKEMIEAQRAINSTGSMRAVCILSLAALEKNVAEQAKQARINAPSLIIVDYEMSKQEDYRSLSFVKAQEPLAGIPVFFMTNYRDAQVDEECYRKGAMVVLHKPFSRMGILRIERMAWQYEVSKNYEKMLQKQASELQAAKEIVRLNDQLKARNELLHQIFGRYFSDQVVQVILEQNEGASLGGEKTNLAVLMSDLRGFTSLSEELESEELTTLLNYYFSKMVDVITQFHGTVIDFLGDGILAVFGAPIASDYQNEDAIAAAITMQNKMGDVNTFCADHGYPMLEMGIGIHQGEAFIGNVGSEKMMRYNVLGKIVNECSRIESASVGGQILVSEQVLESVKVPLAINNQMEVVAKGVQKIMPVGEVIGMGGNYQLRLADVGFGVMSLVPDWITLHMYPIEDKLVGERPILARLKQVSNKRAVAELEDFQVEFKRYKDVEVFAENADGQAVFTGVYAKVVKRQFDRVTLHFTHISKSFKQYLEHLSDVS